MRFKVILKKVFLILIVSILLFLLIGAENSCSRSPQGKVIVEPSSTEVNNSLEPKISNNLKIKIFFDNTNSLEGFANSGSTDTYCRTVLLLEDTCLKCWPTSGIDFFRFGNTITELPNRDYLQVINPSFYNVDEEKSNIKTKIDNVISYPSNAEDNLKIIVTDLFQDQADINLLVKQINDSIISKGLAFGIIGIKSEFDGIVYDLGIDNLKVKYSTKNKNGIEDPKRFKPFYLLVVGKISDIYYFYNTISEILLKNFSSVNSIVFSNYYYPYFLVTQLATNKDVSELKHPLFKDRDSYLYNEDMKDFVAQYSIPRNENKKLLSISLSSKYFVSLPIDTDFNSPINFNTFSDISSSYGNFYNSENLSFDITGKSQSKEGNVQNGIVKMINNDIIKNTIKINNKSINNNSIKFDFSIDPDKWQSSNLYQFEINVYFAEKREANIASLMDWDMKNETLAELLKIVNSGKYNPKVPLELDTFDGSRTINLGRFISNLNSMNNTSYKSKIAQYNFLIFKE